MASADFLTRIPTPRDAGSTKARMRISPGIAHPPSRLCLSDIRHSVPCKFRALTILAALPRCDASYPLPVRQASALPSASSRSAVTRDTLAVQLTLPLAGRVEDFHLRVGAPCRAHQTKTPRLSGVFVISLLPRSGLNSRRSSRLQLLTLHLFLLLFLLSLLDS